MTTGERGRPTEAGHGARARPARPPVSRRRRFLTYLAWAGPGIIAANAGNDAGGIVTYASAGAQFGYRTLFFMVLVTIALVCVQEMAARLGAFTGKGLAALIREEFTLRAATFALACLILANVGLVVSEFAGIGAALELFGVSRYISIPIAAVAIWALVLFGSYRYAERIFLVLSLVFFAYPMAAILAHPDWAAVSATRSSRTSWPPKASSCSAWRSSAPPSRPTCSSMWPRRWPTKGSDRRSTTSSESTPSAAPSSATSSACSSSSPPPPRSAHWASP